MKKEQGRGWKILMKITSTSHEVVPLDGTMRLSPKTKIQQPVQFWGLFISGEGRVEG